jgi:hypothetical protein
MASRPEEALAGWLEAHLALGEAPLEIEEGPREEPGGHIAGIYVGHAKSTLNALPRCYRALTLRHIVARRSVAN